MSARHARAGTTLCRRTIASTPSCCGTSSQLAARNIETQTVYSAIKEFNDLKGEDSRSRSTRVITLASQMLDSTVLRFEQLRLADPEVASNPSEYQKIAKSVSELEEVRLSERPLWISCFSTCCPSIAY